MTFSWLIALNKLKMSFSKMLHPKKNVSTCIKFNLNNCIIVLKIPWKWKEMSKIAKLHEWKKFYVPGPLITIIYKILATLKLPNWAAIHHRHMFYTVRDHFKAFLKFQNFVPFCHKSGTKSGTMSKLLENVSNGPTSKSRLQAL